VIMKLFKPVLAGALLVASPEVPAFAQNYPQQSYQGQQGYQDPAAYQARDSQQQLENLVAPIALYPDALLSQVLVASTYPQQLAEASQWLAQTGNIQGQQRLEAAQQQNWDPSVQALVAFPDVLQRLTQDPRWTADLGNAFLNNEADVMNAVQDLRKRAQQSGRLQSTPQQTVNVENYNGERAIEIVPANPEVVYVPVYNPAYIWGPPAYGYYPSLYYPSVGFGFGGGVSIGAFFGGYRGGFGSWGWGPNWHNRTVIVNNDFFYRNRFNSYRDGRYAAGSNVWRHDPSRGSAFVSGNAGRQPTYGPGNYNQQTLQPGFRPEQRQNPQYQAPADRYTRQFGNQAPQQLYAQPRYSPQQPRTFQQTQQRQLERPRSFQQPAPQQSSRPNFSQPQGQRVEQRGSGSSDWGRR
jgi:Protein of unknown function (DUF3300)